MANVTQQIPNYVGGVSRVPDFKKELGQVSDITNGYPDLTYGLLKRPGTQFLYNLDSALFPGQTLDAEACFHVIDREGEPTFIVVAHEDYLKIFNLDTGAQIPIDFDDPSEEYPDDNGIAYFAFDNSLGIPQKNQFDFVSDDRRTVIVNRTTTVQPIDQLRNGYPWAPEAYRTVSTLGELPDSSVKKVDFSYDAVLTNLRPGEHILSTRHQTGEAEDQDGYGLTVRVHIKDDFFIDQDKGIDVVSPGYGYYEGQAVIINGTNQAIRCTTGLFVAQTYHVVGPNAGPNGANSNQSDDFYMIPGSSRVDNKGGFYWLESYQPTTTLGIRGGELPHELVYLKDQQRFKYRRIDYAKRWVGNAFTNPDPSFVGHTIDSAFFYNNRLGFLSEDNVILSRPIVYDETFDPDEAQDIIIDDSSRFTKRNPREVDFYRASSIQQNDADPIDINAANNRVSKFSKGISTPQGVLLFANGQQCLLSSLQNGPLTPSSAEINNLSVFECDANVKPVAMDKDYFFLDQSPNSSKLYKMSTFGQQDAPLAVDVTKEVQDWCPNQIDNLSVVQTAGMIILSRRDLRNIYIYRSKGDYESWFRWELPNRPIHIYSKQDVIYFVMFGDNSSINVARAQLFLYPNIERISTVIDIPEVDGGYPNAQAIFNQPDTDGGYPNAHGDFLNPIVDGGGAEFMSVASSTAGGIYPYLDYYFVPDAVNVAASSTGISINIPADFPRLSSTFLCIVSSPGDLFPTLPSTDSSRNAAPLRGVSSARSGYVRNATITGNVITATGDFTNLASKLMVGYRFNFSVDLPTFYYNSEQGADYTAYLSIARIKFALSLSGEFNFKIRARGNTEWTHVESYTPADYYLADTPPLEASSIVQVPVHQRNTNFNMKLTSDSPFPLALNSCMWEGNYSPRYYRRT